MTNLTSITRGCGPSVRLIVGGALALAMIGVAAQECKIGNESVSPYNGNTTRGKTGIMRCVDAASGALMREQEWRDGKAVGLERFYEDGKLAREHAVNERGNKQGRAREFAPSGQVLSDEVYDNGSVVGLSRRYYPTGKLSRLTFYDKGQQELAYASFTPAGQLSDLHCADQSRLAPDLDDARLCGFKGASKLEFFGEGQALRARAVFDRGQMLRLETLFDSGAVRELMEIQGERRTDQVFAANGVKLREDQFIISGKGRQRVAELRYADSGKLTDERRWSGGKLESERKYYLNGQLRNQFVYSTEGEQSFRTDSSYHDNGKLSSEGRYRMRSTYRDHPVGVHRFYLQDGKLRREVHYNDKGQPTRERAWDEQGNMTQDDEVFEDGSRKAFAK